MKHEQKALLAFAVLFHSALPAEPAESIQPSLAFLEYLGEWESEDGQWLDPAPLFEEEPEAADQKEHDDEKP